MRVLVAGGAGFVGSHHATLGDVFAYLLTVGYPCAKRERAQLQP